MKLLNTLTLVGLLCGFSANVAANPGTVTLRVTGNGTNTVQNTSEVAIASDEVATVVSYLDSGLVQGQINATQLQIEYPDQTELLYPQSILSMPSPMQFAGPCVLRLWSGSPTSGGMVTVRIDPGQYPPDKSAVIGERDGPMKCTMEESTDLVNWTQSTSGQTHSLTNANAKKFFRIKLEQDVGP